MNKNKLELTWPWTSIRDFRANKWLVFYLGKYHRWDTDGTRINNYPLDKLTKSKPDQIMIISKK